MLWDEAVKINGADPDFHRRDLWDSIQAGDFPEWELGLQVFDDAFADAFAFDVLDSTKLIPEEDCPIRIVGRLVLNQMVDNFFAETEQVAFCTSNVVPGIDFTNDPLLQGRNFSYLDTQIKRLGGPNFTHIPINAPRCPMHHFQQDGHMAMHNPKGRANYEPNGWLNGGPRPEPAIGHRSFPQPVEGEKRRVRAESFSDHYSQARQFYISQTGIEQTHIADALTFELSKVETPAIRARMVAHLPNIDASLAQRVADGLGMDDRPPAHPAARETDMTLQTSDALSILKNPPRGFVGRKLGILITDGVDAGLLTDLMDAVKQVGGKCALIAPKVGGVVASDGQKIAVHHQLAGAPSVLFDAVAILADAEGAAELANHHAARGFVIDAFAHAKFIALSAEAIALTDAAGLKVHDDGMLTLQDDDDADAFVAACADLRFWERVA